jgi:hypothetical protein
MNWIQDLSFLIKVVDPHHLLSTGVTGVGAGIDFVAAHASAQIDYVSAHLYPEKAHTLCSPGSAFASSQQDLEGWKNMAASLQKPLILGEFGLSRDDTPLSSSCEPTGDCSTYYSDHRTTDDRDGFFDMVFHDAENPADDWDVIGGTHFWLPEAEWDGCSPLYPPLVYYTVRTTDTSTLERIFRHARVMIGRSPVTTPAGADVSLSLGGGVSLEYERVTAAGVTQLHYINPGVAIPSGYTLFGATPAYFDITTTAQLSGTLRLCLVYDEASLPQGMSEDELRLLHFLGDHWEEVPTTVFADENRICGLVQSLSPFALVVPSGSVPVLVQNLTAGWRDAHVVLTWTVAVEALTELATFDVVRAPAPTGPYSLLTRESLPAAVDMRFEDDMVAPAETWWYRLQLHYRTGAEGVGPTVTPGASPVPTRMALEVQHAAGRTLQLCYALPRRGNIRLAIYDVSGRLVRELEHTIRDQGTYVMRWDGCDADGRRAVRGVYLAALQCNQTRLAKKVVLVGD